MCSRVLGKLDGVFLLSSSPPSPSNPQLSKARFHFLEVAFFTIVDWRKVLMAVLDTEYEHHLVWASAFGVERVVEGLDFVPGWTDLLGHDLLGDCLEVSIGLPANLAARVEAGMTVIVGTMQLQIEAHHHAFAIEHFPTWPTFRFHRMIFDDGS